MVRIALLILVLLAAFGEGAFCQAFDGPDGLFQVDGRAMALHCSSGPPPTLVFDHAWGDSSKDWESIAGKLSAQLSVCIYDRAGYGESDPGPLPRSPYANARELRALLNVAGVQPPYVIAGHSSGGLNAQAFWELYPTDVAGLILLDPTPTPSLIRERFPEIWGLLLAEQENQQALAAQARLDSSAEAARLETMVSEDQETLRWSGLPGGSDAFGDLPLLVVAAGRPRTEVIGASAVPFQDFWINENRALAGRSTAGRVVVLDSIGHAMGYEAPAVIIELIRGFMDRFQT
jgi:pimeloyl-ACP methyl ester carboxylesterase